MQITSEELNKLSQLARISLTAEEKERLSKDLSQILNYVEKINELDTSNVEPTAHILDIHNVTRPDEAKESMPVETVIEQAPKSKNHLIIVPQVI